MSSQDGGGSATLYRGPSDHRGPSAGQKGKDQQWYGRGKSAEQQQGPQVQGERSPQLHPGADNREMMRFARQLGVWLFHHGPQNENDWADFVSELHHAADTGLETAWQGSQSK